MRKERCARGEKDREEKGGRKSAGRKERLRIRVDTKRIQKKGRKEG